ncbi:MAG: PAS domain-containing protein [Candidatus Paracaedibacteraceae bacterium]|nr:PAS domain-containing protein [Candidatus Paracaedibacteraceae bacterium]
MNLTPYIAIGDAFVKLMYPLVEIVIHDLSTQTIKYINGELSRRKAGEDSLLDIPNLSEELSNSTYTKIGFDGRLIKSISVLLSEEWLMCINCDVSVFHYMQQLSQQILQKNDQHPSALFKNDWQEKLHIVLHDFITKQKWDFQNLSGAQKKEVLKYLFDLNAFTEKNAADYIANILNVGRATVFKYLKEWRNHEHK